uniref:C-type lectin domain-containing protein n=1 Tax=Glossina brevipalpis TaxID=37001 RepID=A0A1A9W772_9MUSC
MQLLERMIQYGLEPLMTGLTSNNENMENHCAAYDPHLQYRWSSHLCVDKHRFICQHKMPKVSEKNRYKVYNRWNATYPNQLANEVILEVIDRRSKIGSRINRRVKAEGSNEVMLVPVRPSNARRRPQLTNPPSTNDINYQLPPTRASIHPNDIVHNFKPTRQPNYHLETTLTTLNNEIIAPELKPTTVPEHLEDERRKQRQRLILDRKLKRQREKELRRLQRKKERQEKMRREKQQRLREQRKLREEQKRNLKLQQQQRREEQQKELNELRQKENDLAQERQQRE